jgi:hypothetical protein
MYKLGIGRIFRQKIFNLLMAKLFGFGSIPESQFIKEQITRPQISANVMRYQQ